MWTDLSLKLQNELPCVLFVINNLTLMESVSAKLNLMLNQKSTVKILSSQLQRNRAQFKNLLTFL